MLSRKRIALPWALGLLLLWMLCACDGGGAGNDPPTETGIPESAVTEADRSTDPFFTEGESEGESMESSEEGSEIELPKVEFD